MDKDDDFIHSKDVKKVKKAKKKKVSRNKGKKQSVTHKVKGKRKSADIENLALEKPTIEINGEDNARPKSVSSNPRPTYQMLHSTFTIIRPKTSGENVARAISHKSEAVEEKSWFAEAFYRPEELPEMKNLLSTTLTVPPSLWNSPADLILSEYGMSANQMAQVCCDRQLDFFHLNLISNKLNQEVVQTHSLCVCVDGSNPEEVMNGFKKKLIKNIKQLVFVMNVKKSEDGSVEVTTTSTPETHWILVLVNLHFMIEMYHCDSLAWGCPSNLMEHLSPYTKCLGLNISSCKVTECHKPWSDDAIHYCNEVHCKNFPYKSNANFSGVLMSVIAVIACWDAKLMSYLLGQYRPTCPTYLHKQSLYNKYLRLVLLGWFIKGIEPSAVSLIDRYYPKDFKYTTKDSAVPEGIDVADLIMHEKMSEEQKKKEKKKVYHCPFCNIPLSSRNSVYKHKKRKHPNEKKKDPPVTCMRCNVFKCPTISDLVQHLNTEHQERLSIENHTFKDFNEFSDWKKAVELATDTFFIKPNGPKSSQVGKVQWYKCNRTGKYSSVSQGKRAPRAKGSCKIGGICCAYMKAVHSKDGSVTVECCLKHTFHTPEEDLQHKVVGMLDKKASITSIMDEIKNKFEGNLTRDRLIQKQDIENLRSCHNISVVMKHKSDPTSVDLWIDDLRKQPFNPVFIYKRQDEPMEGANDEEFLLGIQTEFQKKMLESYGGNCICVGAARNVTSLDFYLITLMVLDEYGEAVPVAWLISSKQDERTLKVFFKNLHLRCGPISTNTWISDCPEAYWNSWNEVFTQPANRLFCRWHLDCEWRRLVKAVVENDLKLRLYQILKSLQYVEDKTSFSELLHDNIFNTLEEYYPEMFKQLQQIFLNQPAMWATCYNACSDVHFSLYLESFQRTLRYIYHKKKNRRVDFLLSILLKVAQDKVFEYLTKDSDSSLSVLKDSQKHHDLGVNMTDVKPVGDDSSSETWVVSSNQKNETFKVTKTSHSCTQPCVKKCKSCSLCIHQFACSCLDYIIRSIPCMHIHAVHQFSNSTESLFEKLVQISNEQTILGEISYTSNELDEGQEVSNVRSKIYEDVSKIAELVKDTASLERLRTVQQLLSTAVLAGENKPMNQSEEYVIILPENSEFEEVVSTEPDESMTTKRRLCEEDECGNTGKKIKHYEEG